MRRLAACLLVLSCTLGPPREAARSAPAPFPQERIPPPAVAAVDSAQSTDAAAIEMMALRQASRARERAGLGPLVRHAGLDRAARDHGRELARRGVLDHESNDPARRTLALRLHHAGVPHWLRIGENLAALPISFVDPGREVVLLWLRSTGHRANLMDPSFEHAGVGAVRATDGNWYIVQVYGHGLAADSSANRRR